LAEPWRCTRYGFSSTGFVAADAGRIMNHLVMVMGSPSEEQRRMLEATTEQWNRQQRWNV
jgi:hypothetical protein